MNTEPASLRAFLAVGLNAQVRRKLSALQAEWRKLGARVSWVRPENLHITLLFLGDIFPAQAEDIGRQLDEVTASLHPFGIQVDDVGWFGSPRSPRVIWAGIRDERAGLTSIHGRISQRIRAMGIGLESREFRGHVTMGRVRSAKGVHELTSAIASAKNTQHGGVLVDRVLLMKSDLTPPGPHYSVLHESLLKGDTANGG
ncbi:MAG: RNA 2',3'-cyclic phosphodiesterase [Verrucomicrobia bacterium]|nr:RNA 2',3'-cyclic phosphodiesterase [Verrucomicrobiota bacterium]